MDDLLKPYYDLIRDNPQSFLAQEEHNFPAGYSEIEKTFSEFMSTHAYYHSKIVNEAYYDANQSDVIQTSLATIHALIESNETLIAQYYIVSLQLLMGMQVRLNKVIVNMIAYKNQISEFVDKEKYFGKGTQFSKGNVR